MKMIPINTKLPLDKIPLIKESLAWREDALKKLKYGDVEESLFLMMEIEHIKKLLKFNEDNVK